VIAVVLAGTGVFVYLQFQHEAETTVDSGLSSRADELSSVVRQEETNLAGREAHLVGKTDSFAEVLTPSGTVIDSSPVIGTADLLDSLVNQTLALMNGGARLDEVIHGVTPPAHLMQRPYLQPVYDEPEFIVHTVWRQYGGWWDGNPASLQPAPERALAVELAELAGGAGALADRALELLATAVGSDAAEGALRLAGHLVEHAWLAGPDDAMKAQSINVPAAEALDRRGLLPGRHAPGTRFTGHFAGMVLDADLVDWSDPDLAAHTARCARQARSWASIPISAAPSPSRSSAPGWCCRKAVRFFSP